MAIANYLTTLLSRSRMSKSSLRSIPGRWIIGLGYSVGAPNAHNLISITDTPGSIVVPSLSVFVARRLRDVHTA
jgi:hypothetical protein